MISQVRCPECGRVFVLGNDEDAIELAYGHDCESEEDDDAC